MIKISSMKSQNSSNLRKIWLKHELLALQQRRFQLDLPLTFVITGHPTEYRSLQQLSSLLKLHSDPSLDPPQKDFLEAPLVESQGLLDEWCRVELVLREIWRHNRLSQIQWGTWIVGDHDGRLQSIEDMFQTLTRMRSFLEEFPEKTLLLDLRFHVSDFEKIEADLLAFFKLKDPRLAWKSLQEMNETERKTILAFSNSLTLVTKAIQLIQSFLNDQLKAGWLIVSFTRSKEDLKRAFQILKFLGLEALWKISPLFETMDDLESAWTWLTEDVWESITNARSPNCLIGFSDTNKSQGYLASQCVLHSLKWTLSRRGEISFFYGRGSSLGRGGGCLDDWLPYQPATTAQTRLTIQGESLYQELFLGQWGNVQSNFDFSSEDLETWRLFARRAEIKYKEFVDQKSFWNFFLAFTPCLELSRWSLSSRPAVRNREFSFESLRAILWVASWCQTGLFFPFWFPAGSLLQDDFVESRKNHEFMKFLLRQINWSYQAMNASVWELYQKLVPASLQFVLKQIREDYVLLGERLSDLNPGLTHQQSRSLLQIEKNFQSRKEAHEIQVSLLREMRSHSEDLSIEKDFRETVGVIASGFGFFA
jgi:phosphoenolpyruvate carboxylase